MDAISKKQNRQFMFYNLIAFLLIFSLFAAAIYLQISTSLFSPAKTDIANVKSFILNNDEFMNQQVSFNPNTFEKLPFKGGGRNDDVEKQQQFIPMRMHILVRNSSDEIINKNSLGRFYWENFVDGVPFSANNTEKVTTFFIGNEAFYSYIFEYDYDEESYTIQLLTDITAENTVIKNTANYLIVGVIISVILSVLASYYLSKRSMKPLVKSWNRQTEFVENASHELGTPLTIVQNKLEYFLTKPNSKIIDNIEDIGIVLSETKRLSKLTKDLMTLARADSNAKVLEKISFDFDGLIREVCEPFSEMAELQGNQLELNLEFSGDFTGDKSRIHQLLVILLDNSLKYSNQGKSIKIYSKKIGSNVSLKVINTGVAVPPEEQEKVFDRFYRVNKERSRDSGGSGLGLSIAKWIVNEHGGTIKMQSEEEKTVLNILLPI